MTNVSGATRFIVGIVLLAIVYPCVMWAQDTGIPVITALKITAVKNGDSADGTGFIIKKDAYYYLVTAKHVFYPPTTQEGFTMPTVRRSYTKVILINPEDNSAIQSLALVNARAGGLLYKIYMTGPGHALDIAVLRIDSPSKTLDKYVLPFAALSTSKTVYPGSLLRLEGYPARVNDFHSSRGSYAALTYQRMLEIDAKYYFIMNTERRLDGNSGGPVFSVSNNQLDKVVGIFVGQNNKYHTLSYVIFADYIKKTIEDY